MRPKWKRILWLFAAGVLLIGLVGLIGNQSGNQVVAQAPSSDQFVQALSSPESPWNGRPFPAVQDTALQDTGEPGLMWGKEITTSHLVWHTESVVANWAYQENHLWKTDPETGEWIRDEDGHLIPDIDENTGEQKLNPDSRAGGYPAYDEDHPDGWRPATLGEMIQAQEDGLFNPDVFDFDFSYQEGHQGANDYFDDGPHGNPPNGTDPPDGSFDQWGERWHTTICIYMSGQRFYRWTFRCCDGSAAYDWASQLPIPVRGAPPNHNRCPKNHKPDTSHGKGSQGHWNK